MRRYLKNLPTCRSDFEKTNSICGVHMDLFLSALKGELTQLEVDSIAPLTRTIGFPENCTEFLINEFESSSVSQQEAYLALIFHTPKGSAFFGQLSEKRRIKLSGPWIRPMLRLAQNGEDFPKQALAQIVESCSPANQDFFLEIIEGYRINLGCDHRVYDAFPKSSTVDKYQGVIH